MKSNAITRIVIYSVIIVLLVGILLAGMGLGQLTFRIFENSGIVVTERVSLPADQVHSLSIDWASGSITLTTAQCDTLSFYEEGSRDQYQMCYSLDNGTLSLDYSNAVQIGFVSAPVKHLYITVPENWVCRKLDIDSASTKSSVQNLTIEEVELDSASNSFTFTNCSIGELDMDGASNKLHLTGDLRTLDCDGMSTDLTLILQNTPEAITLDGMSSKLDLTFFDTTPGFQVRMEGMSNQFHSDFATQSKNGTYFYGDGRCRIEVNGMSSKVTIREGK